MATDNLFARLLSSASLQSSRPEFVEVKRSSFRGQESQEVNQDNERSEAHEEAVKPSSKPRTRPLKNKISREDTKADRTVFVGNLTLKTTKRRLKAFFADCGAVDSIRFRSVVSRRVPNTKRPDLKEASRFNAYVVFKESSSVESAMEKNGSVLGDQKVRVDGVTQTKAPVTYPNRVSVFIGNVPHEVKEDKVHQAFAECGEVEGVRLVRDKVTGLCKGYGFVQFTEPAAALLATKTAGSIRVEGRQLRVLPCKPEGARGTTSRLGTGPGQREGGASHRGQQVGGKRPGGGAPPRAKRAHSDSTGGWKRPMPSSGKVWGAKHKFNQGKKPFASGKKLNPKPKHLKRKLLQQQQQQAAQSQSKN